MITLEEVRELLRDGVMAPQHEEPEPEESELRLRSSCFIRWISYPNVATFVALAAKVGEWNLRGRETVFINNVKYHIQKIASVHWHAGKMATAVTVVRVGPR